MRHGVGMFGSRSVSAHGGRGVFEGRPELVLVLFPWGPRVCGAAGVSEGDVLAWRDGGSGVEVGVLGPDPLPGGRRMPAVQYVPQAAVGALADVEIWQRDQGDLRRVWGEVSSAASALFDVCSYKWEFSPTADGEQRVRTLRRVGEQSGLPELCLQELVVAAGALRLALQYLPEGVADTDHFRRFWAERVEPLMELAGRAQDVADRLWRERAQEQSRSWYEKFGSTGQGQG